MKRRDLVTVLACGGPVVFGAAARAASDGAPPEPWEWVERRGLDAEVAATPLQFMPSLNDARPLEDELTKFPRCPYCGMARDDERWRRTRHLVHYLDDSVDPTCSIHCAALSLGLNLDLVPKAIYGADAGSAEALPPLLAVEKLHYVIDPSRPGTMTRRSKWAYADLEQARAAASGAGELADFDQALRAAYADMAEDTILIRKRRAAQRG
jgi:nitrous oxide reductase accessory protein NosL